MGCDLSKAYNVEIKLENELAVFEPRDEVAGRVVLHASEETVVHSCAIWLYGVVRTRWKPGSTNRMLQSTSLIGSGLHSLYSTSQLTIDPRTAVDHLLCNRSVNALFTHLGEGLRNAVGCATPSVSAERNSSPRLLPTESEQHKQQLDTSGDCTSWSEDILNFITKVNVDGMHKSKNLPTNSKFGQEEDEDDAFTLSFDDHMSSTSGLLGAGLALRSNHSSLNGFPQTVETMQPASSVDPLRTCKACLTDTKCLSDSKRRKDGNVCYGATKVFYKAKVDLLQGCLVRLRGRRKQQIRQATPDGVSLPGKENDLIINQSNSRTSLKMTRSPSVNATDQVSTLNEYIRTLVDDDDDSNAVLITRGVHTLPFEFRLPSDLPSSFELPTGCLVGGASARLYYALRFEATNRKLLLRHSQKRELVIFRPLELTRFPRLRDRVALHKQFVLTDCCLSTNGMILCDMTVNKTGFVPGESIIPEIHVVNHSNHPIQTVHLTFVQNVLLHGVKDQQHMEVLRLFASRLHPKPTHGTFFNESATSPSITSSGSTNHHHHQQELRYQPIGSGCTGLESRNSKVVAVVAHGGSAYFEDVIHVPPLPASGLFGRQNLIYIEYMLVLRLRLQGDKDGRFDQLMQIPITIGSDPTRETSFTGHGQVVPCYARFNFASGEVLEYNPTADKSSSTSSSGSLAPVYRYFKPSPRNPVLTSFQELDRGSHGTVSHQSSPRSPVNSMTSTNSINYGGGKPRKVSKGKASSIRCQGQVDRLLAIPARRSSQLLLQQRHDDSPTGDNTVTGTVSFSDGDALASDSDDDLIIYPSVGHNAVYKYSGGSNSPQSLRLSNQLFFDDGDQVTVTSESDQLTVDSDRLGHVVENAHSRSVNNSSISLNASQVGGLTEEYASVNQGIGDKLTMQRRCRRSSGEELNRMRSGPKWSGKKTFFEEYSTIPSPWADGNSICHQEICHSQFGIAGEKLNLTNSKRLSNSLSMPRSRPSSSNTYLVCERVRNMSTAVGPEVDESKVMQQMGYNYTRKGGRTLDENVPHSVNQNDRQRLSAFHWKQLSVEPVPDYENRTMGFWTIGHVPRPGQVHQIHNDTLQVLPQ